MSNPIYLEPNLVPAHLRGNYCGKKFKVVVCESVTIPATAGLWDGGSRDMYRGVNMETGLAIGFPFQNAAPWDRSGADRKVTLSPGFAVVLHSTFCGKDAGLTFYVHPDNAAKLLPAPQATLTPQEIIVLGATCSYKSSYGGKDRYQMAQDDYRYSTMAQGGIAFMSRADWDNAKAALIGRGLLNKAGAVTPAGRNANNANR